MHVINNNFIFICKTTNYLLFRSLNVTVFIVVILLILKTLLALNI